MLTEYFLALRIGFTSKPAINIKQKGYQNYLNTMLDRPISVDMPTFMNDAPKTRKELKALKNLNEEEKKKIRKQEITRYLKLQNWWVNLMKDTSNPLQEKMVLFWHNHFVSSYQKVKLVYPIYEQNQLFRKYVFGNYKKLTKEILYNNAMIIYLDNNQNKALNPNENLSRELLELFTLGIGNYSENEIKEGARILAGLSISEQGGKYYNRNKDNGIKTYFGKKGNFDANDMVDIIFEQTNIGHLLATKLIKYFVTDMPDESMIEQYAALLKQHDFEIKPVLQKLLNDERFMQSNGMLIKDPTTFLIHTTDTLGITKVPIYVSTFFLKQQGMELFNPPNVKGWDGGKSWLDSQKLLSRNQGVETLCRGILPGKPKKNLDENNGENNEPTFTFKPYFDWNKNLENNKEVINYVLERLLFQSSSEIQANLEQLVKYDFDPKSVNADNTVLRIVEYVMKQPEFQLC